MSLKNLSLVLIGLAWVPVAALAAEKYAVLDETESPDHRYAIGWGMKGIDDIAKADPLKADSDEVENYVVDLKEKTIVTPLRSAYWHFQDSHPNHRDFETKWSADSAIVVALYTMRWGDLGSFEAVLIEEGKAVAKLDLGKSIEPAFRRFLAQSWPEYTRLKNSIDPLFSGLKVEREGILSVTVMGGIPGDKSGESFSEEAAVQFSVVKDGTDLLRCDVLGIAKARPERQAPPTPAPTADPTAKADKNLNAAYKALQSKLDQSGREVLKAEQRAWLLERDKITDSTKKIEFIEKRAAELEARAKAN
jgi:hypothetical protein